LLAPVLLEGEPVGPTGLLWSGEAGCGSRWNWNCGVALGNAFDGEGVPERTLGLAGVAGT
jgi:hypothetical protein